MGRRRGRDPLAEGDRLKKRDPCAFAAAGFHGRGFDPDPGPLGGRADPLRRASARPLPEAPEYRALRTATALDPAAAGIAAAAFAAQFAQLRKEGTATGAGIGGGVATPRAVSSAAAGVADVHVAAACGLGEGAAGSNDPGRIAGLYCRARSDPALRKIVDRAGRSRRLAQSKPRQKPVHGTGDVAGVELGGDVSRLLPHELAELVIPELADDVLRRIVERQAVCRRMTATEPVAKGPVIVCADEPGSMVARGTTRPRRWPRRGVGRPPAAAADRPARTRAAAASGCSRCRRGSGTRSRCPTGCRSSSGTGARSTCPCGTCPTPTPGPGRGGETDVLFLPDAKVRPPAEIRDGFLARKVAVRARLATWVIGGGPGARAAIGDECHAVRSPDVAGGGVGRAVSV